MNMNRLLTLLIIIAATLMFGNHVNGQLFDSLQDIFNDRNYYNNNNNNKSTPDELPMRQSRRSAMADTCVTNDGLDGTCMTRFNCMRQGGTAKGFCGTYGVCCETNLQCNQMSKLKRTIIRNPASLTQRQCQYTIEAYNENVCQLLIKFQHFELQQPSYDATAERLECNDVLEIGSFRLCGDNSGQHIYIPVNVAAGAEIVTLNFDLPQRWSQSSWRIIVTQLECPIAKRKSSMLLPFNSQNNLNELRTIFNSHHSDLDLLAPLGCDQYFTEPAGTIKSFNYRSDQTTLYLPNMNYVICVKPSMGATMIEYTVNSFSLSKELDPGFDGDCHSYIMTMGRREDYLMIPQSTLRSMPSLQATYYCGTSVTRNQVIIASQPFVMYFSSDSRTETNENGFSFEYRVKSVIS